MGVVMTRNVMMKAEVVMQGMINSAPKMGVFVWAKSCSSGAVNIMYQVRMRYRFAGKRNLVLPQPGESEKGRLMSMNAFPEILDALFATYFPGICS